MKSMIILVLTALCAFTSAASAQTPDLTGTWMLQSTGNTVKYPVMIQADGNSWNGVGRSKVLITLRLDSQGMANQWAGDLEYFGKHKIGAKLNKDKVIELRSLEGKERWTLTRKAE